SGAPRAVEKSIPPAAQAKTKNARQIEPRNFNDINECGKATRELHRSKFERMRGLGRKFPTRYAHGTCEPASDAYISLSSIHLWRRGKGRGGPLFARRFMGRRFSFPLDVHTPNGIAS